MERQLHPDRGMPGLGGRFEGDGEAEGLELADVVVIVEDDYDTNSVTAGGRSSPCGAGPRSLR